MVLREMRSSPGCCLPAAASHLHVLCLQCCSVHTCMENVCTHACVCTHNVYTICTIVPFHFFPFLHEYPVFISIKRESLSERAASFFQASQGSVSELVCPPACPTVSG